ncbi:putative ribonuclease H-like domain-containing protein, partial [Tanacetum coccineum]
VKELDQFNLISVSQICDKKHRVLFTEKECIVLSSEFKLPDLSMVIFTVPRRHNLYTFSLNDFSSQGNITCILVQVYVDDIIFGSTRQDWSDEFESLMQSEFEKSSMGQLTFFLGLQVDQRKEGIFIHQQKSMIGSLMYLTASRPDIMFAVSACARNQVSPTTSNLLAVKRIFKYLKAFPKLGLW